MIEVTQNFAIYYYVAVITGYLIYKTMRIPEGPGDQQIVSPVVGGLFVAAVLIFEYMITIGMIKTTCGFEQWEFGAMVTFVPWILIVGTLLTVLMVRPGWLVPFSNTFGYFLASAIFGLSDTFKKLMRPQTSLPDAPAPSAPPFEPDNPLPVASAPPFEPAGGNLYNPYTGTYDSGHKQAGGQAQSATMDVERALQEIYEDESLLINQITPENIDAFIARYTNAGIILKPSEFIALDTANNTKDVYENLITQIRKAVYFKLFVSEYIWLLLSGILAISVTSNYIANYGCKMTPEQLAEKEAKLAAIAAAEAAAETEKKKPKIGLR
jgi:hypothetical protein